MALDQLAVRIDVPPVGVAKEERSIIGNRPDVHRVGGQVGGETARAPTQRNSFHSGVRLDAIKIRYTALDRVTRKPD